MWGHTSRRSTRACVSHAQRGLNVIWRVCPCLPHAALDHIKVPLGKSHAHHVLRGSTVVCSTQVHRPIVLRARFGRRSAAKVWWIVKRALWAIMMVQWLRAGSLIVDHVLLAFIVPRLLLKWRVQITPARCRAARLSWAAGVCPATCVHTPSVSRRL